MPPSRWHRARWRLVPTVPRAMPAWHAAISTWPPTAGSAPADAAGAHWRGVRARVRGGRVLVEAPRAVECDGVSEGVRVHRPEGLGAVGEGVEAAWPDH